MAPQKAVSLISFAKGVIIAEGNVTITEAEFVLWDYMGKSTVNSPALRVNFTDMDGGVYDNYYSVGREEDFVPSKDGKFIVAVGKKAEIHESTNFFAFFNALKIAGFNPSAVNSDDIGCIVGTEGHIHTITIKRTGTNIKEDSSLVVFDQVTKMPGETKGKASGKKAPLSDEAATDSATSIILTILGDVEDGSVSKANLLVKTAQSPIYVALDRKLKSSVIAAVRSDEFLSASPLWTLEGGIVAIK